MRNQRNVILAVNLNTWCLENAKLFALMNQEVHCRIERAKQWILFVAGQNWLTRSNSICLWIILILSPLWTNRTPQILFLSIKQRHIERTNKEVCQELIISAFSCLSLTWLTKHFVLGHPRIHHKSAKTLRHTERNVCKQLMRFPQAVAYETVSRCTPQYCKVTTYNKSAALRVSTVFKALMALVGNNCSFCNTSQRCLPMNSTNPTQKPTKFIYTEGHRLKDNPRFL
jgi:hypothetical protein